MSMSHLGHTNNYFNSGLNKMDTITTFLMGESNNEQI